MAQIKITVMGEDEEYPAGAALRDVAMDKQDAFEHDILLATVDGKLQELHKKVRKSSSVDFVTAVDGPGHMSYECSALFVMLKAFYDVVGKKDIEELMVDFSYGDGLFIEAHGNFKLTEELVNAVRERMRELVDAEIPIRKRTVSLSTAMDIFKKEHMYMKERLFAYRRTSRVNLYSIDGFEDYFYGYMLQNTGYVRYFDLQLYDDGMLLLLPSRSEPEKVQPAPDRPKLFATLRENSEWGKTLGVSCVGDLNDSIVSGRINDIILIQEALMEKKLGDIAQQIAEKPDVKLVMIAGPSSSGKTTFANRLSIQLRAVGLIPHLISVDNYFLPRELTPRDAEGNYDYEGLDALDVELFNHDLSALIKGEKVDLPTYNFITGEREYNGESIKLGKDDILVIEGIHCLNEKLSYTLPRKNKFKIYISALTALNVDEHNRISTNDARLLRRIARDSRTRGATAQYSIKQWPSVRRGEEENIFPFQEEADVFFNSALVYELAVLKPYVEPLLFAVPKDCEEYVEANRLLKFLDYFLAMNADNISANSIVREFIGGGCFKV